MVDGVGGVRLLAAMLGLEPICKVAAYPHLPLFSYADTITWGSGADRHAVLGLGGSQRAIDTAFSELREAAVGAAPAMHPRAAEQPRRCPADSCTRLAGRAARRGRTG